MSSKFYTGDSLEILRTLPDNHVQCVVTSPPYWGLRDYGVAGQMGLEPTFEEYVAKLIEVFREVRRLLRDDGTLWLNMGDSYASQGGKTQPHRNSNGGFFGSDGNRNQPYALAGGGINRPDSTISGLKSKDLIGMPWRLALALQADGWYLRSDIIWHKPNPMPESVQDRPTKAHEYIFLLTKSSRYFWDIEGVKEKIGETTRRQKTLRDRCYTNNMAFNNSRDRSEHDPYGDDIPSLSGRNIRSIWTIPTKPFKELHFATFPPALVERCVKAGTSERGCCPSCGKAWEGDVERGELKALRGNSSARPKAESGNGFGRLANGYSKSGWIPGIRETRNVGFRPACQCSDAIEPIPCTVLDPFSGSGTVALVCERLGRDSIGIELNPRYVAIAERRLELNRRRKVNVQGKEVQDLPGQAQFAWMSDAK